MQRRKRQITVAAGWMLGVSSAALYWYYYLKRICKKPRLYVTEGPLKEVLKRGVPNLFAPYRPSPWLLNSHLMTVAGVLRRFGGDCYDRELMTMADGGTVGLDWFIDSNDDDHWNADTPILLVMHGLTGGSHEGYCRWMCYTAYEHKWRSVVLNYRGCNGVPMTTPKGYTPAVTDDVYIVIDEIKRLRMYAEEHKDHFEEAPVRIEDVKDCQTIKDFELATVCQLFGFPSWQDYCKTASSQFHIPHIRTQSLILVAEDDPFVGYPHPDLKVVQVGMSVCSYLPIEECLGNKNVALAVTSHGGHVAFLQGLWPFGRAWMEDTAMQFFESCLQSEAAA